MFAMKKYGSLVLVLVLLMSVLGLASCAHADGELLLLLPSDGGGLDNSQQPPAGDGMLLLPLIQASGEEEIAVYEIRFLNYKGETVKTVYLEEGAEIVNPKITPTLMGYTFSHWCDVTAGTKAFVFGTAATRDFVLRPYFVRNEEPGSEIAEDQNNGFFFGAEGTEGQAPIGLLGLLLGELIHSEDGYNDDAAQGTGESADQNQSLNPVADNPLLNAISNISDGGNAEPPADNPLLGALSNITNNENPPADNPPANDSAQSNDNGRHGNTRTAAETRELMNTDGIMLANGFVLVLNQDNNGQDPTAGDPNKETDDGMSEGDLTDGNLDGNPQEGDPAGASGDGLDGDGKLLLLVGDVEDEEESQDGESDKDGLDDSAGDTREGEDDPEGDGKQGDLLMLVPEDGGENEEEMDGEENQEEEELVLFVPDERGVTITTDASGEVTVGDLITLTAVFEEHEGEVLEYTWQYFDGGAWMDYQVGGSTASFTLTQESYRWEWRVIVKIIAPEAEA